MYVKIPYVEAERQVLGTRPGMFGIEVPIYNTPVTPRENFRALFDEKHPYWIPSILEVSDKTPPLYNNTLGRGMRQDMTDIFGVKWKYVEQVGGSTVEPGHPFMDDIEEWHEKIKFPDIDTWDWETAAKENEIDPRYPCQFSCVNGFWFERLISFMDFMYAAMALIDEDQIDEVKGLFAKMTELGCKVVDKFCEYWPMLDLIEVHDDWGSQKAPFFSQEVADEIFVPFMKKLTDRIHSWGRHTLLHSCGHNFDRVQCYIDGGFDLWAPQTMNDVEKLYDQYGDKIVLAIFPPEKDLAERNEEEQRAAARRFADRYSQPGKPVVLGLTAGERVTPAFQDELYKYSRKIYLEQK